MTPYRSEDIEARVAILEERLGNIDRDARRTAWLDFLKEFYIPQAVGILLLLGIIGVVVLHMENCSHQQTVDAAALAEAQAAAADDAAPEQHRCERLCESMGLRGGVVMDYTGTGHVTYANGEDSLSFSRTGHSCMCGNGMGGSVRVDPDGRWSAQTDHPGPAADGGVP